MTIQQLEYIVAVNKFRHFVKASEYCGVTQPTLSHMVQKLEAELDVVIFNRSKHPIEPTSIGEKIIRQAELTLREKNKMTELVQAETKTLSGPLKIGIIPTLAPYLTPQFIFNFNKQYPEVQLTVVERTTASCIDLLSKDKLDMFIAATPLEQDDFYEIPLYYERFVAYFSENHPQQDTKLAADNMPQENLWVLEEGHCLRDQIFNFCTTNLAYNNSFEAGSIDTLIRIVDTNGGYSVIPQMHLHYLKKEQLQNVRDITNPPAIREISVIIKQDFIKERLINAVADTIKAITPEEMLDERLKKFSIRL